MREMAGDVVAEGRNLAPAALDREGAARMERAAGRGVNRVRRLAADRRARAPAHCEIRHGVEQHARIGVTGPREQVVGLGDLDEASEIHDADAPSHEAHHGEIVGDQEVGEPELLLQVAQKVQDLRLD